MAAKKPEKKTTKKKTSDKLETRGRKPNPPKPYEMQSYESAPAFEAFVTYRELGPRRSIVKAAETLWGHLAGAKKGQMEVWSAKYQWVERSKAWDAFVDDQSRKAQIDEVVGMRDRHAKMAEGMLVRVAARLNGGRLGDNDIDPLDPSKLSAADLAKWLESAVKIERLSRGEPDGINENRISGKVDVRTESQDLARRMLENPELAEEAESLLSKLSSVE